MRQRLLLLGLVLAFVTPFALGWGLYAFDWRPQQVKPHGVLVTPALAVATGDWHQPDGAAATAGQWTLALLQTGDCGDACRRSLYLMRQIEATQAREASRVQRAVLTDAASASLQREVAAIGHTEIWQGPLAGLAVGLPDASPMPTVAANSVSGEVSAVMASSMPITAVKTIIAVTFGLHRM